MTGHREQVPSPNRKRGWGLPVAVVTAGALVLGLGLDASFNDSRGIHAAEHAVEHIVGRGPDARPNVAGSSAPQAPAPGQKASASPASQSSKPHKHSIAPPATQSNTGPVIVIDPGHSGQTNDVISTVEVRGKVYNIRDHDYPNYPEIYEVFAVSQCTAKVLREDGYDVKLTKKHATSTVTLARRAEIANKVHAALAFSVHDDHTQSPDFQAVYDQKGLQKANGEYPKLHRDAQNAAGHAVRLVFHNPQVADASRVDAEFFAKERTISQGRMVHPRMASIAGRPGLAPGNAWMVQVLSNVPWVYNETGAQAPDGDQYTPLSIDQEKAYATGLVEATRDAVPIAGAPDISPHLGLLQNCLEGQQSHFPASYRSR